MKAIDPIGNSLKIDEYLNAFHLGFLDFISMPVGILLSAAEFLIGVCILKGIKMKLFSKIALVFISFFTLLTLYSAIFNPVQDCGCFGEAVKLTNWETFFKNVVLLGCAFVVWQQKEAFKPIATPRWKYIYIGGYSALILGISLYALIYLPQIDFGIFKPGTDIASSDGAQPEHEYETLFTYSKDGKEESFTLDNLPDSSWTFVTSETKLISASSYTSRNTELILKNGHGVYVTDEILLADNPIFILSVYNYKKIGKSDLKRINRLYDSISANNAQFYILSGNSPENTEPLFSKILQHSTGEPVTILYSDYRSVLSLNRSNGGLTYIDNGTVVKKWSRHNYPEDIAKLLSEDSEVITAEVTIREQLFAEIMLVTVLFLILIIRFFSKIIYKRTKGTATQSQTATIPEQEATTDKQ